MKATAKHLPPLPATIYTLLGPVTVEQVPELRDEDGKELFGMFDAFARVIKVRAGMHPHVMWSTLFHEQTHADIGDIGVALTLDQEEAICNAIASARVGEMLHKLTRP